MDSEEYESEQEMVSAKKSAKPSKKMSVERIYQRKTPLEHILLRPDTYIGSVEMETKQMWVYDEAVGMVLRDITYVPGIYKIFDEILVNAADNKQRDKNMNCIRVDIDADNNEISIYNNGKGIPVIEHNVEKMWVPTLIFGHLLTSSNYNDEEKKVVGGRNGYGAKLCNVFSTKFTIETSCKEYKKCFKQRWANNMRTVGEPKINPSNGEDYTKISFHPDLSKFKMDKLDKDIVALFSRRAYDVAGSTKGVKVFLNGKKLPVNGFKDYIDQYIKDKEDEMGNPLKISHEVVNDRWEIAVTVSDKGFQQISFVNSIATTRGGKHVDYVADQIVSKMADIIKKKNKAGVSVKPFQIRNHLWVFVNCLIENPTFDSQTKETMTLQTKSFGSKCAPSDKFFGGVNKIGVVEAIMCWVKFKAEKELAKNCHAKKHAKLKGIPKLEDANDAGTRNSIDCTLILTEGDSAKSLVVAGLGVIGRDKYGVFPLRGKMLNVREASHKQILENAEINNLIKIMGLQYKKKYESNDDLKSLRYGKIMIMTDQDQDGSHIKGLLINFIHHNWPSLLKLNFLEEFITPIVKVSKGSQVMSFYSLPEFEEWKKGTTNWSSWKVKYYKGLGTSTAVEAKEYFSEIRRHRITFKYEGNDDDNAVMLAFSKKMVEQRKDWLTSGMEQRKRRRELGLSEVYLYEKDTRSVSYKDFVNKELILFSNMDNERSIPSLMDGLKPGQRKVMFTCFKRNDKREVKVAQLAGSVGEHSAYHHGEASLMSTIINLAQDFVGSNNINLLQPRGQFGTRLQGGKDAASPRYIFTMLSPLARKIFSPMDDPLLNYLYDDNLKIEPEFYVPIIPMVLVNGAEGIGTGWSTKLPNYNPRQVVENIRRMLSGEEPTSMIPWFKGFRGDIVQIDSQRFLFNGEVGLLDEKSFEITELPIRVWTQTYKESVLELLLHGNEKTPAFITDYKEYHTESTVRFVVTLTDANLNKALQNGIHKTFKLQSTFSTTSMVLFDHNGVLNRYETPEDILTEFFPYRLEFYGKRKRYYEGMLHAEAQKLANQARFILEKNEGKIVMENIKKANFIRKLIDFGYDSDPVKAWKAKNGISVKDEHNDNEANERDDDANENDFGSKKEAESYDYDYLFDMTMRSMLREKVDELLKKRDAKKEELEKLRQSTPEKLWEKDLDDFIEELNKVEEQEKLAAEQSKPLKLTIKTNAKYSKNKSSKYAEEAKPSAFAERVAPKIDSEMYKKSTELAKKGQKRKRKDEENSPEKVAVDSDSDIDKPLAERIGTSPQIVDEKKAKSKGIKTSVKTIANQSLNNEKPKKKPMPAKKAESPVKKRNSGSAKKKRNPWSESDSEDDDVVELSESSDDENNYVSVNTITKPAKKQKLVNEPENCETSPLDKPDLIPLETSSINENHAINNDNIVTKNKLDNNRKKAIYDSDDDMFSANKAVTTTPNKRTSEELFDAIISNNGNESNYKSELNGISELNSSATTIESVSQDEKDDVVFSVEKLIRNKPTKASKKAFDSGSDSESIAKAKQAIKPTKASKKAFESDTDDDFIKSKPKKTKTAKIKKKTINSDSSEDETPKKKKSKKKESLTFDKFEDTFEMSRATTGRVRQPVKYNFGDDTTDED